MRSKTHDLTDRKLGARRTPRLRCCVPACQDLLSPDKGLAASQLQTKTGSHGSGQLPLNVDVRFARKTLSCACFTRIVMSSRHVSFRVHSTDYQEYALAMQPIRRGSSCLRMLLEIDGINLERQFHNRRQRFDLVGNT